MNASKKPAGNDLFSGDGPRVETMNMGDSRKRGPFLATLYEHYLDQQDSTRFVEAVSRQYTQGTLERLARHDTRAVRRAAVLALGFVADYSANGTLGMALTDEDRTVRLLADTGIRNVWTRSGEPAQRRALAAIMRLNSARRFDAAVRRASQLIAQAEGFAEAWNQRAIAFFSLGRYAESIRDCHQTLEINPYHFGAAAGMGQAYLRLGNYAPALECFRRALRLNPDLEAVRVQAERLARLVEGKPKPGGP